MSLIPLLLGAPAHHPRRHNRGYYDDDWAVAAFPARGYYDPFVDMTSALSEMDHALSFVNREVGRLSNQSGGMNMNQLMSGAIPDIVEENGQKKIQYSFDVRGFKPEDITLKTREGRLVVSAKHQEGSDDHQVVREFHRMVAVPEGVKIEDLKSRLVKNGVLQIEAPYNPPAIENKQEEFREIPITHEPSQKRMDNGDTKQVAKDAGKK